MQAFKGWCVVLCVVLTAVELTALQATLGDYENIRDLYEYLLQKEALETELGGLEGHQVQRKSSRSPSLRLRFGRRSDPDLLPVGAEPQLDEEIVRKVVRSPSLRLRFGRRSDPLMSALQERSMSDDQVVMRKPQRSPSFRLRFGRSDPSVPALTSAQAQQVAATYGIHAPEAAVDMAN